MKRMTLIAAFGITLASLGIASSASAQTLGACPASECECTAEEAMDYDSCTLTTNAVDPLDIATFRKTVEFTLHGSDGLPNIEAQIKPGTIFEVNQYNGNWPSVTALEDYVNELVYGQGGASETPFERISICDLPGIMPTVGGDAPRYTLLRAHGQAFKRATCCGLLSLPTTAKFASKVRSFGTHL